MDLTIAGYEQLSYLGKGGFSVVYRAYEPEFDRNVAIKVIDTDTAVFDRAAFDRERRALGSLAEHPNIVNVWGSGVTADGRPYISMELFDQGTLLDRMTRHPDRQLPAADLLAFAADLADALAYAHDKNILHRDIKPRNVLFKSYRDTTALADFGIAHHRGPSGLHRPQGLTYDYAPPEVIDGGTPSEASDLYSLGATFYTALAGRRPFHRQGANSPAELTARIHNDPPPQLHATVPRPLAALITALRAKAPAQRPQSARQVAERLAAIRDGRDAPPAFDRPSPLEPIAPLPTPPAGTATPTPDRTPAQLRPQTPTIEDYDGDEHTVVRGPAELDNRPPPTEPEPTEDGAVPRRRMMIGAALAAVITTLLVIGLVVGSGLVGDSTQPTTTTVAVTTPTTVGPAPDAPDQLIVAVEDQAGLRVTWAEVDGASSYRVRFVNDSQGFQRRVEGAELVLDEYEDPTGAQICVDVVAISDGGRTGPASRVACLAE